MKKVHKEDRSTDIKNIRSKKRIKKTHQNTDLGHTEGRGDGCYQRSRVCENYPDF